MLFFYKKDKKNAATDTEREEKYGRDEKKEAGKDE